MASLFSSSILTDEDIPFPEIVTGTELKAGIEAVAFRDFEQLDVVVFQRSTEADQAVFIGNLQGAGNVRAEIYLYIRHGITVLVNEMQEIGF